MSTLEAAGYPLILRGPDLCRVLGIHKNTLVQRIRRGDVPKYAKAGRRYEWYRPTVETWLEHRKAGR